MRIRGRARAHAVANAATKCLYTHRLRVADMRAPLPGPVAPPGAPDWIGRSGGGLGCPDCPAAGGGLAKWDAFAGRQVQGKVSKFAQMVDAVSRTQEGRGDPYQGRRPRTGGPAAGRRRTATGSEGGAQRETTGEHGWFSFE